ncbi:hypothetical protein C3747_17g59 [Trypanosoma cruzi]|uniref:Uncharacterized protein n=1 Tax=Trypanosoma cruzi TaxID=5693 RepID=A0A2V2X9Y7_TRYCR|nr:hypothetical protein C3747_17g59 [Trypanosoma cruzi]
MSAREQYSRQQLASAWAAQCSVVGPQLFHRHVDGLPRRLDSIYLALAFVHADDRTLVALGADGRECAAAMSTALSAVATWSAEHSLKIEADGSGAALFCIASNRNSDEDAADHRLGGGNPRVKSHLVLLLGNAIDRQLNFVLHFTPTAGQTVPRRRQPRLGAVAGAFHHIMRSLLAGWMRPHCFAPRRRGSRTVSSSHSPPQPGSAARRQLHSIARPTRINEGYFCPPGRQFSTAAEDHWVSRTHTARTPHASPVY